MIYDKLNTFVINNVYDDNHIEYLYKKIDDIPENKKEIVEELGLLVFHNDEEFSEEFISHTISKIQPFFQEKLIPCEIYFSRYTNKTNYFSKLPPHYDFKEERRITFDIQIKSNVLWPLFVEDKEFTLNDNDGLVFSGTDQIHWRKNITLKDNEFVDMILFQLKVDIENDLLTDEDKEIQRKRSMEYANRIKIFAEPIKVG